MLATERPEFEREFRLLCAGFNVMPTPEREEAYWRGLHKLPLPALARIIEHVLGESGAERMPTPSQVWKVHRELRSSRVTPIEQPKSMGPRDTLADMGQVELLRFLMSPAQPLGASEASLQRMITAKNVIIGQYRILEAEQDVDPDEIAATLAQKFERLYEPMPQAELEEARARHRRLHPMRGDPVEAKKHEAAAA